MGKKRLVVIAVILMAFAGCKDTDNAANWVGIYTGTGNGTHGNNFNQLVISESNHSTIRISADTVISGTGAVYTYATIQNVNVQSASAAGFNELDSVLGYLHPLQLTGNVALNGNTIIFSGTGISA